MRESDFIDKNKQDWERLESLILAKNRDADELQTLFVKVSSDLTYARSFYPKRSVRIYLNNLTLRVFTLIQSRDDKPSLEKIQTFFTRTLPYQVYESRKAFYLSLITFVIAMVIGAFSGMQNPDFLGVIVGQEYVDMTNENINSGDPMAVYKQEEESTMFFQITMNNVKVAFLAFVLGFFGIYGTMILLFFNGVMVGAFQYFFYSKGLFWSSFLTIWVHGTIEISVIIVAGAAGIVLGQGVVFNKTYEWTTSVQVAALKGIRIVVGTVPLFFLAGFLEGFATRHTEWPTAVKLSIILASLGLILYIYVYLPWQAFRSGIVDDDFIEIKPSVQHSGIDTEIKVRTFSEQVAMSFVKAKEIFAPYLKKALVPIALLYGIAAYFVITANMELFGNVDDLSDENLNVMSVGGPVILALYFVLILYSLVVLKVQGDKTKPSISSLRQLSNKVGPGLIVTALIYVLGFYLISGFWVLLILTVVPLHYPFVLLKYRVGESSGGQSLAAYKHCMKYWTKYLPMTLLIVILYWTVLVSTNLGVGDILTEFFSWHDVTGLEVTDGYLLSSLMFVLIAGLFVPMAYGAFTAVYYNILCKTEAFDLQERYASFGKTSETFEQAR